MNINAINQGIDSTLFERLVDMNKQCPYHNLLDIDIAELSPGEAKIVTHICHKHMNSQNISHGGVACTLVDTAMGYAIRTLGYTCVTLDISLNYLDPVKMNDTITATGRVIRLGNKIIVADCTVTNQDDKKVVIAKGSFYNKG